MSLVSRGSLIAGLIVAALSSALLSAPAQAAPCVSQPGISCAAVAKTPLPKVTVVANDSLRLSWSNAPFTGSATLLWAEGQKVLRFKHTEDWDTIISGVPNVAGLRVQFTDTQHNLLPSNWSKTINHLLPAQASTPKLSVKDNRSDRAFSLSLAPNKANGSTKVVHYQIVMQHRSRKSTLKKVTGWNNWGGMFGGHGENQFSDSYPGVKAKSSHMTAKFWHVRNYGSGASITRWRYRVKVRACSGTAQNGYYAMCGAWSSWSNTVLVAHGKLR